MTDIFMRKVLSHKEFGAKTAVHKGGLREYRLECGHISFDGSNRPVVVQKHCRACEAKFRMERLRKIEI